MFGFNRLVRRNHTYYIRAKVPDSLQILAGRREFKYTLHTNNYWEALALLRKESYRIDLKFNLLRQMAMLIKDGKIKMDLADVDRIIVHKLKQLDEVFEIKYDSIMEDTFDADAVKMFPEKEFEEEKKLHPDTSEKYYEIEKAEEYFQGYVKDVIDSRPNPSIAKQFNRIIDEDIPLISNANEIEKPQMMLLSAMRGVDKFVDSKITSLQKDTPLSSNLHPRVRHCLIAVDKQRTEEVLKSQKSQTKWQDIFNELKERKKNISNITNYSLEQSFKRLQIIFGIIGKKYIEDITYKDCQRISDIIFKLPVRLHTIVKNPENLKASDFKALFEKGYPTVSKTNAIKYLRQFKELLRFAKRRRYIIESLDDDVDIPKKEQEKKIDGFGENELKLIFNPVTYPRKKDLRNYHNYWIPLIALYTGCRLNEIAQLYVADIKYDNKIWYFQLTDEREDQHLKTRQSRRIIPVHPKLKEMGFIDFVKSMRNAKQERLFPKLKYHETKYYRSQISHWFGRYLDKIGLSNKSYTFHSIRHCCKRFLRDSGVPQEYQNALCGWQGSDTGEIVYGGAFKLENLYKEISKLKYPFLEQNLKLIKEMNE